MYYAGIDLHKKTTYISVIDDKGNLVAKKNLASKEKAIGDFLESLPQRPKLVMESTRAWYWLYDFLKAKGYEVVVSHPKKTKAIAAAKIKNDKLDSHMLAQLLRAGLLATVHVSDPASRELKETLRHRARLVRDSSRMKNRIHNLLAKNNVELPVSDIFGVKGRELLFQVELPAHHQRPLERYLHLYDEIRASIEPLDKEIRQRAKDDEQARLLMSLPGVGPVVALTLLAEIGDISRFKSHRQLAAYAGLVPSLHSSAGKDRLGRISKEGSTWMRWALVEAAQSVARSKKSRLGVYFRKKIVKLGYRKATVATAHRLLQFVFYLLRDQRPYVEQFESAA